MFSNLVRILALEKSEIVSAWANNIKSQGGSFNQLTNAELMAVCTEFLEALMDVLEDGSFLKIRAFIDTISTVQSSQGFRLSEVQRAYYGLLSVLKPLIARKEGANAPATTEAVQSILMDVLFELSESYHKWLNEKIDAYISNVDSANIRLKETSIKDALTGCYNQRYFQSCLDTEVLRSKRYQRPLSLAVFDLDHLKKCNDEFGHAAGDEVLRNIGSLFLQSIRASDMVFRYGGEEFSILLPETGKDKAFILAERIRTKVAQTTWTIANRNISITISGGVNGWEAEAQGKYELASGADKALSLAKERGGNNVALYE